MPLPAAEYITNAELHRRALALLNEHYGPGNAVLPIDVESILELTLKRLDQAGRRELQAERFAAYLLMPEHLIHPKLTQIDLRQPGALSTLATDCGVSRQALQHRLDELGVIRLDPDGTFEILRDGQAGRRLF